MRRALLILLLASAGGASLAALLAAGAAGLALSPAAAHPRPAPRLRASRAVNIVLPPGWRLVRSRLTPVVDPAPVLAAATFPARSAAHLCTCDTPNLRDFPRGGAFVFMWEYLERVSPARLRRMAPPRPARFSLAGARPQTRMCLGPSYGTGFRAAGHAFQLEVYLGPGAGPRIRRQVESLLDSMRIGS